MTKNLFILHYFRNIIINLDEDKSIVRFAKRIADTFLPKSFHFVQHDEDRKYEFKCRMTNKEFFFCRIETGFILAEECSLKIHESQVDVEITTYMSREIESRFDEFFVPYEKKYIDGSLALAQRLLMQHSEWGRNPKASMLNPPDMSLCYKFRGSTELHVPETLSLKELGQKLSMFLFGQVPMRPTTPEDPVDLPPGSLILDETVFGFSFSIHQKENGLHEMQLHDLFDFGDHKVKWIDATEVLQQRLVLCDFLNPVGWPGVNIEDL